MRIDECVTLRGQYVRLDKIAIAVLHMHKMKTRT